MRTPNDSFRVVKAQFLGEKPPPLDAFYRSSNDSFRVVKAQLLGTAQDYVDTLLKMQAFTKNRTPATSDEIWFLEHAPVFTCGVRFTPEHVLNPQIPIIHTNRGGELTFHGAGQLIIYFLMDLKRLKIKPRDFMHALQNIIIAFLKSKNVDAFLKENAPGVYTAKGKIASLGLKIEKHCTYHGLAFNGNMNLKAFDYILPCGEKQKMTDLTHFHLNYDYQKTADEIMPFIEDFLNIKLQ